MLLLTRGQLTQYRNNTETKIYILQEFSRGSELLPTCLKHHPTNKTIRKPEIMVANSAKEIRDIEYTNHFSQLYHWRLSRSDSLLTFADIIEEILCEFVNLAGRSGFAYCTSN